MYQYQIHITYLKSCHQTVNGAVSKDARYYCYYYCKADSYGNEKLIQKWTESVCFFFNFMGTRMVQIRIAESV